MYPLLRRGFTLLEIMLVIIVLAVVLVFMTTRYKGQTTQTQTDTTAAEMQALLQAAQTYYNNNSKSQWPSNIAELTNANSAYQLNPCGQFILTQQDPNCGNHNSYELQFPEGYGSGNTTVNKLPKASVISISTIAPNRSVADQLAAKLPSATVNNTTNEVTVTVPSPLITAKPQLASLMNEQKLIMVKSVYTDLIGKDQGKNLSSNLGASHFTKVKLPNCPDKWTPGYDVAFNQYLAMKGDTEMIRTDNVVICKRQYNFKPTDSNTTTEFTASAKRTLGGSWHAASVMVITYCVPPSVAETDLNLINKFKFNDLNEKNGCQYANFTSTNG